MWMRAQFTLTAATAERKVLSIAHALNAVGTIVIPLSDTREKWRQTIRMPFQSMRMKILEINSIFRQNRDEKIETKKTSFDS